MTIHILNKQTSTNCSFKINGFEQVKEKVLNWAKQFDTFCFLDNHGYQLHPHTEECLLAAGIKRSIRLNTGTALEEINEFISQKNSWLFGHLGYDLKNEFENLSSNHPTGLGFPDLFFFEPEVLLRFGPTELMIESADPLKTFNEIEKIVLPGEQPVSESINIESRLSEREYISVIEKLKAHILRGDCYEINFCLEFFSKSTIINPLAAYKKLSAVSPNPFSALYRLKDQWVICASPERYLKKTGTHILSQPIKGTLKRDAGNEEKNRKALFESEKDRSENVMVVDLVRNDLSRVCKKGTVQVDELYGIYSFPQVYQMISTVSGELKDDISFAEIIRATFPMGSMTGAPKKRVMELIEQYEKRKRGIFSGALGYISPDGDFDLNVVIRSILYNEDSGYLSFPAGSGITFYSDPEKEWEECLLKAEAIRKVLTLTTS